MKQDNMHSSPAERGHHHRRGKGRRRAMDHGALRLLILQLIAEQPRHGYEIITELEARSGGAYRPSPGTVYPALTALEEAGQIACETTQGRRKLCSITEPGRAALQAGAAQMPVHDHGWRGRAPTEIREAMERLKSALRTNMRAGADDAAIARMAAAIDTAARAIATETPEGPDMTQPVLTRHRHELKRRDLTVSEVTRLTPKMVRITFDGEDLADFTSLGFDDHVKLIFDTGGDKPAMRDYTPRRFDSAARRLVIDFALHEAGPATAWAMQAAPGDQLTVGGPRGSAVIAPVFDWYLLVGDETALPAIGRRVEELPADAHVITLAAVTGADEEQDFGTAAQHWVHRANATNPAPLTEALAAMDWPEGRGFVWIAAEAGVARALKRHVLEDRGHPGAWLKAAGYWVAGQADASDKALD